MTNYEVKQKALQPDIPTRKATEEDFSLAQVSDVDTNPSKRTSDSKQLPGN